MTLHTYCKLCGEEFKSEWHFRIMMWKWSHARRNHPDVFREALRQRMRTGKVSEMDVSKCDRCLHNTPISGCVHEEGWRHYYEEDTVTECEWFEEAKK